MSYPTMICPCSDCSYRDEPSMQEGYCSCFDLLQFCEAANEAGGVVQDPNGDLYRTVGDFERDSYELQKYNEKFNLWFTEYDSDY